MGHGRSRPTGGAVRLCRVRGAGFAGNEVPPVGQWPDARAKLERNAQHNHRDRS
ncbi:MAG: hypothetical protein AAF810_24270 [Cyanobacteria bacterium P01_D01_bin.36]